MPTPTTAARNSTSRGRRAGPLVALVTVAALALVGCGGGSGGGGSSGGATRTPSAGPTSHEYRPGLLAFPHLPKGVTAAPVVVMIPGGNWQTADPSGLEPLADALESGGVVAMPVVIRAADDGVIYPVPVEDVLCALADGAATAREAGIEPTRLVLLGHSSGAHLSAVAALAPDQYHPACDDPPVVADALVGLAGPYDIRQLSDDASSLFAADAGDATWDAANPMLLAGHRPEVPVLLLHGDADEMVPPQLSTDFAAALRAGGHPTTLSVVPAASHDGAYTPQVAAGPVLTWLRGLPQD